MAKSGNTLFSRNLPQYKIIERSARFVRKNPSMLILIIVLLIFLSVGINANRLNHLINKRNPGNTHYSSLEDAGLSQWKDFTLTSTPDIIKKGVTDISKYYL